MDLIFFNQQEWSIMLVSSYPLRVYRGRAI